MLSDNYNEWYNLRYLFTPTEILIGERGKKFYYNWNVDTYNDICISLEDSVRDKRPVVSFFCGHRGNGKSSMLIHLIEKYKDDFFIIYFNAGHNLDTDKSTIVDLLYLIGAAIYQTAEKEDIHPDIKYFEGEKINE